LDATDIVSALRAKHHSGKRWEGVDVDEDGTCDTVEKFVWEPALVKQNAIAAATEAACMILSVDETVKNAKSESLTNDKPVH
jgi:T-complex protein 1 subunit eta